MKKTFLSLLISGLALFGLAADAPRPVWPNSKKYPVEILKVLSPTEVRLKLLEDGKIYTFRMAHVKPLPKNTPKNREPSQKTFYDQFKSSLESFADNKQQLKRNGEIWIEFETDEIYIQPGYSNRLVGYLFYNDIVWRTGPGSYPWNAHFVRFNRDSGTFPSEYQQEAWGDSKGKDCFDFMASLR